MPIKKFCHQNFAFLLRRQNNIWLDLTVYWLHLLSDISIHNHTNLMSFRTKCQIGTYNQKLQQDHEVMDDSPGFLNIFFKFLVFLRPKSLGKDHADQLFAYIF